MKKPLLLLGFAALAVAAFLLYQRQTPESDDARTLTLYGNIDVRLVNLAFEIEGRIAEIAVSEGASVTAGEQVARLDTRRLLLARDVAKAQVDAQRSELDKLIAGVRPEEIQKLRADLEAARAEATRTKRHAKRAKELAERKLVSPQEDEDAQTSAKAAEARAGAVQAGLDLALAGTRQEEIAAAKARLAAVDGDLANAQVNLDDAVLRAPASGIVQSRILEPGDMASPSRPVLTLALTEPLWARVYLAEPDLGRVKQGQPAAVYSDSFPDKAYAGWIGYIAPSAEFTPKNVQTTEQRADLVYQARVFVCNPRGELRQGMPVTVKIDLEAAAQIAPGCIDAAPRRSQP
ncbi:HlyD family efflux transporter periplasmic adaptor subunit [Thiorhodococcus mannitoliphagus]|uniref:HlyD family efflux transporter periplasmic adaptor subunit n=1 Tax=Thiorhodococcus mannitoliphagus TaxID=329406 RepID=A0A6P1DVD9_9GAMM|nr:HlyD family efflux transporter periplasmic adaptor subunit [Thiorhodococcus mannitoliphagus]NEX19664.1 HlyD family efflux transporter periplasmic adaptor subunit [Thiorhodococcus mannitoliphagus]